MPTFKSVYLIKLLFTNTLNSTYCLNVSDLIFGFGYCSLGLGAQVLVLCFYLYHAYRKYLLLDNEQLVHHPVLLDKMISGLGAENRAVISVKPNNMRSSPNYNRNSFVKTAKISLILENNLHKNSKIIGD